MLRTRQPLIRRTRVPTEGLGLFCNYSHRVCMQTRLDGFDYCIKHILEDKTSPYKQCSFISNKTNRRCGNAAPRADRREGYCLEHSRKACIMRQQASRKRRPKETAESLLEELDHYNPCKESQTDLKSRLMGESLASKILDYESSSESSDSELPLVEQAWRGDGESDAESIDSEQEDPLKHAGIYTAEEVTLIMKDKLIRLQSLYIEQFKRLQHILKEKRRKYLHTTKLDKDTHAPQISKGDLETQKKMAKLAALKRYHQRHGKEALLQRQSKERRVAVSEGLSYKPPPVPKCTHTSSGTRCHRPALPLIKFCANHVVDDPHQVLFQPCGFADGECGKPVVVFTSPLMCTVHLPLAESIPLPMNDSEEQVTRDTEILSAENSMETSELSAVDDTGLQLLAAQSSILSAVSIPSDALSASSDTLSANLDEPYMSSDVPSASSDIGPASADVQPQVTDMTGALGELPSQSHHLPVNLPSGVQSPSEAEMPLQMQSAPACLSEDPVTAPAVGTIRPVCEESAGDNEVPQMLPVVGTPTSDMQCPVTQHTAISQAADAADTADFVKPTPLCSGGDSAILSSTMIGVDPHHSQNNLPAELQHAASRFASEHQSQKTGE